MKEQDVRCAHLKQVSEEICVIRLGFVSCGLGQVLGGSEGI